MTYPSKAICTVLAAALLTQPCLPATNAPVPLEEMQKEMAVASQARQHNRETLSNLLSTPQAQEALRIAHVDVQQVKTAISSLNDEDLAKLAARADTAQKNLAAGDLSQRDLLLILVGIAVIILIIVAVR